MIKTKISYSNVIAIFAFSEKKQSVTFLPSCLSRKVTSINLNSTVIANPVFLGVKQSHYWVLNRLMEEIASCLAMTFAVWNLLNRNKSI